MNIVGRNIRYPTTVNNGNVHQALPFNQKLSIEFTSLMLLIVYEERDVLITA